MKKLQKILFTVIAGLFVAGIASASLGEYWSTISHIIPRTDSTVDIGSNAKKVKAIWTDAFYGDYWISGTGNSMNVQPTGDTDDFFSFKTPADRPTIKREGGKYIYIESSNVNDVGISFRKDADHSGTVNYYKDENLFGLTSKDPLVFKVCADYDDYVKICAASNVPEMSTVGAADFKINAGGANDLLLNHSGGNVGIGTTTPSSVLEVNGTATFNENIEMKDDKKLYFDTAKTNAYIKYDSANDDFFINNDIAAEGILGFYSNAGADGSGTWAPYFDMTDAGTVSFVNHNQGNIADRYFKIAMNSGLKIITTGSVLNPGANLKADNIATTHKTFQFPNYSGTFITSGNLTDITTVGTIAAGTWNGTSIADANVDDNITVTGYMQDEDINTFTELQSWVADEVLLKAGTLTDTKYCIYDSASGDIICNSTPTGSGDITDVFDCSTGDCNTMTVGTSEWLTYGTGFIDANRFAGVTTVDSTEFGYLNGLTAAIVQTGSASHDGFSDFVANEHIDWTADQGATNIHTGNYTAGLTNLTDFDQTAWRLFYSNNLGDVIELSLGTNGEYLQSQGGTSSLTWSTPTDTTANETITLSGDIAGSGATAITTTIGADKILESHLKAVDAAADEECLTYEATTGDFEWQTCGGSLAINDITDITIDTPADNEVLAYNNGTSTWLNQTPAEAGLQGVLTNSAGLLAALNDETGTGLSVFSTSPTFTTPLLGTPTSGVLTNCTGTASGLTAGNVTTNANLTGDITSVGNATTITADVITHADIADSDQTDTKCFYLEDPTADDDLKSIWRNSTANNFLLTEIWGESDQTVSFDLQVDDGTPADVSGTDIAPAAGEAEDTTLAGDTTLAASEELDLIITSVSGTPTWLSVCFTGNWVD